MYCQNCESTIITEETLMTANYLISMENYENLKLGTSRDNEIEAEGAIKELFWALSLNGQAIVIDKEHNIKIIERNIYGEEKSRSEEPTTTEGTV